MLILLVLGTGVAGLLGRTLMGAELPTVELAKVRMDTVRRRALVLEVKAAGTLVPEHLRYVVALTSGRVDALPIRPGSDVTPTTVLVTLSNPDVQLETLDAERRLADAEADLLTLQTNSENQRLSQVAVVGQLRAQHAAAARDSAVFAALAARKLASVNEAARAVETAAELGDRVRLEEARQVTAAVAERRRLQLARTSVERMRAIREFQRARAVGMNVQAGESGHLLSIGTANQPLERGQWVVAGQTLATVAQSGQLKAVLRVPETQAKDIAVGQPVSVDTRNGVVKGHVTRSDPTSVNGMVQVEVGLDQPAPPGARADLGIDASIEIARLPMVLQIARPAAANPSATADVFRVDGHGKSATRTSVAFGRSSGDAIEIRSGLAAGDRVIISDMAALERASRVKLR